MTAPSKTPTKSFCSTCRNRGRKHCLDHSWWETPYEPGHPGPINTITRSIATSMLNAADGMDALGAAAQATADAVAQMPIHRRRSRRNRVRHRRSTLHAARCYCGRMAKVNFGAVVPSGMCARHNRTFVYKPSLGAASN